MERTSFENLRVYQLSEILADSIWEISSKWNSFDRDTIGKQIVRSADSIGANIAEGCGRYGTQDNKRFGYFARGSLNENKTLAPTSVQKKVINGKRNRKFETDSR